MKVNEIVSGVCVDLTHDGLGVIKFDNFPVFVPNILIGEEAIIKITKVNKSYSLGELVEVTKEVDYRVKPSCKYFYNCGGCDLMHMDYNNQLKFKINMVNNTFKKIGKLDFEIKEIIPQDNPYKYRNKVIIPYKKTKTDIISGFYKKKTHDLIKIDNCLIQNDLATSISIFLRSLFVKYNVSIYDEKTFKGLIRNVLIRNTSTNKIMVVFITKDGFFKNSNKIISELTTKYKEIVSIIRIINNTLNNTILSSNIIYLYKEKYLEEDLRGLKFNVSPNSFFQINHEQTEKLYNQVIKYCNLNGSEVVVDCYCGVGTMSLLLSRKALKVYGIEIIKEAVDDAIINMKNNFINNAFFICGKVEEKIHLIEEDIDIIVVDPPRKGLDLSLITTLSNLKIKKIVYVSCDCATLARDINLLKDFYKVTDGVIVDMFPQTKNCEVVVCLERI